MADIKKMKIIYLFVSNFNKWINLNFIIIFKNYPKYNIYIGMFLQIQVWDEV